jgi:hypothetical protein
MFRVCCNKSESDFAKVELEMDFRRQMAEARMLDCFVDCISKIQAEFFADGRISAPTLRAEGIVVQSMKLTFDSVNIFCSRHYLPIT